MQRWTPLGHLRAIGAWPAPPPLLKNQHNRLDWNRSSREYTASSRQSESQINKSWAQNDRNSLPTDAKHSRAKRPDEISSTQQQQQQQQPASARLPRSPFFTAPTRKSRVEALNEQRKRNPSASVYRLTRDRTLAQNMREAPFSTRFAQNPYAHMLGTPVREEGFTGSPLPKSCMLSFHVVGTEPKADDSESKGASRTNKKQTYELLPLALGAALVPKKKNRAKLSHREMDALSAAEEDTDWEPKGSASYLMCKQPAVDFVSEMPFRRVRSRVTSVHVRAKWDGSNFTWRDDMAEYLLNSLRKLVQKRLRSLAVMKGTAEKKGMMIAVPAGEVDALEKLNLLDGVLCVLKLTSADNPLRGGSEAELGRPVDVAPDTAMLNDELQGLTGDGKPNEPTQHSVEIRAATGESEAQSISTSSNHDFSKRTPGVYMHKSLQSRKLAGPWREKDPIHGEIYSAPAPPSEAIVTYYPTIPYRNQRVPTYNLPYLLGPEYLHDALEGTVFEDTKYVAITSSTATVQLQIWLLKLTGYISNGRDEALKI